MQQSHHLHAAPRDRAASCNHHHHHHRRRRRSVRRLGRVALAGGVLVAGFVAPAVAVPGAPGGRPAVRAVSLDLREQVPAPDLPDLPDHGTDDDESPAANRAAAEDAPDTGPWFTTGDVPAEDGVMVGADWGGDETTVAVRARRDGSWTDWRPLPVQVDLPDGPEARDANVDTSAPVWFGPSEVFQVRASAPVDLDLHVVRDLPASQPTATADADTTIRPRGAWGADESLRTGDVQIASAVRYGVIHHEGGTPRWTASEIAAGCVDAPAAIRAIYAYHTQVHGWWDIGYNFVVDPCGRIWEGRWGGIDQPVVGSHAAGFNWGAFGVLALGTFNGSSPDPVTSTMVTGLEDIFAWKFSLAGIDATTTVTKTGGCSNCSSRYPPGTTVTLPRVSAHQVTSRTSCPGAVLLDRLFNGAGATAMPRPELTEAILAKTTAPPPVDAVVADRWAGANRVETAVEASAQAFDRAGVAVLATTTDYADGLVAAPLAASQDGPVLLTPPTGLPDVVASELHRLGVTRVDLVGGTAAIGSAVVDDLEDAGVTTVRRLAGGSRWDTARVVAADVRARTGGRAVLVALGDHPDPERGFPDALTAGGYGAATVAPVLLVSPEGLPEPTRQALRGSATLDPVNRVVLVGGQSAISAATEQAVRDAHARAVNLTRFGGANRYETATLAMDALVDRGLLDGSRVVMSSGRSWPDALGAAAAAGHLGHPLLLVPPRTGFTGSVVDRTTAGWGMRRATVIGGEAVVSDAILVEITTP